MTKSLGTILNDKHLKKFKKFLLEKEGRKDEGIIEIS
jgi:hypothetical protein